MIPITIRIIIIGKLHVNSNIGKKTNTNSIDIKPRITTIIIFNKRARIIKIKIFKATKEKKEKS